MSENNSLEIKLSLGDGVLVYRKPTSGDVCDRINQAEASTISFIVRSEPYKLELSELGSETTDKKQIRRAYWKRSATWIRTDSVGGLCINLHLKNRRVTST